MRITIKRDLHTLFRAGVAGGLTDAELLLRFIDRRDPAAFESLVHRHGPWSWACARQHPPRFPRRRRRVPGHVPGPRPEGRLGRTAGPCCGWLYGVAPDGHQGEGFDSEDESPGKDRCRRSPNGRGPRRGACRKTSGRSSTRSWAGFRPGIECRSCSATCKGCRGARPQKRWAGPRDGLRPSGAARAILRARLRGGASGSRELPSPWPGRPGRRRRRSPERSCPPRSRLPARSPPGRRSHRD